MKAISKLILAALALVAASCSSEQPVLKVDGGYLQGIASAAKGVTVFKGIPYAAPPVGELRWQMPQPVVPWSGVKTADTFGPIPWQKDLSEMTLYGKEFYSDGMPEMSEDCLYLNVWAPTRTLGKKDSKLPVALWIHGGAFDHGYGHEIEFDGDSWASRGVILVTFNYREGIFGFFGLKNLAAEKTAEGRSGNYAVYDQLAALEWVRNNIAVFGGDPDNITLFGQSAGARSVQTLVSAPITKDKIAKAIMQSGGGINPEFQGREFGYTEVWSIWDDFCAFAGYTSLEQLRGASPEELMQKCDEYVAAGGEPPFEPMIDMYVCGRSFTTSASQNELPDIPYMIGCTTGDGRQQAKDIDQFCASRVYYEGKPVYEYMFSRKLPGDSFGAFHSSELWYMFGTLDRCWRPFTDADRKLSKEMLDAWTNFCKYGNPCGSKQTSYWYPFTQEDPYRKVFDVENK